MPFVDALSALFSILVDFAVIGAIGKIMLEVFPERQPPNSKRLVRINVPIGRLGMRLSKITYSIRASA